MNNQNEIVLDLGGASEVSSKEPKIIDTIHIIKQATYRDWLDTARTATPFIPSIGDILLVTNSKGCFKIGNGQDNFEDLEWSSLVKIDENGLATIDFENLDIKPKSIETESILVKNIETKEKIIAKKLQVNSTLSDCSINTDTLRVTSEIQAPYADIGCKDLACDNVYAAALNVINGLKIGEKANQIVLNNDDFKKIKTYDILNGFKYFNIDSVTEIPEGEPGTYGNGMYLTPLMGGNNNKTLIGYKNYFKYGTEEPEFIGDIEISASIETGSSIRFSGLVIDNDTGSDATLRNDSFNKEVAKFLSTNTTNNTSETCLSIGEFTMESDTYYGITIGNHQISMNDERKFCALTKNRISLWNFIGNGGIGYEVDIRARTEKDRLVVAGSEDSFGELLAFRRTVPDSGGEYKVAYISDLTKEALLNRFYPIGSLYWCVSHDINPADIMGGTWIRIYGNTSTHKKGGFPYILSEYEVQYLSGKAEDLSDNWKVKDFPMREHSHNFGQVGSSLSYTFSWGKNVNIDTPVTTGNTVANNMRQAQPKQNELVTSQTCWHCTSGVRESSYLGGDDKQLPLPPHINMYCWKRTG